jgi:hypothetical protein
MKLLQLFASLASMSATVQGQIIDLSKYDQLTTEQKTEFFGGMSKMRLQNESDFLKALTLGSQDASEVVRRRTAQRAAMSLLGLQQLVQAGRSAPISPADVEALERSLKSLINDADRETRAAAVRAIAAVRAPSQSTELLLLGSLEVEEDEELRANLVETMTAAGYQSASFKQAIVNRIAKAGGKELEALATSANRLHITEALPALIERIGQPDTPQVLLLRSVGRFGNDASAAKSKLEAIIADPASTNQVEAQSALVALTAEPLPRQPTKPFVDLVASTTTQNTAPDVDAAPRAPTVESSTSEAPEAKSTTSTPNKEPTSSTPWSVVAALIVAASGLLWLLLKGRK